MTKTTRRIIFYFLCAAFLVLTPVIILYSKGLTFDWENRRIVKTGGLFVKSTPPKADIFLNGEKENQAPYFFSHLLPKSYLVKVEKEGFHPWEKTLEVKGELVTEVRNIFLFPKSPAPKLLSENATSAIPVLLSSSEEKEKENQAKELALSSLGYLRQGNDIYFISKTNYNLYKTDLKASFKEQISKEPLAEKGKYKIILGNASNRLAVISSKNNLYLLNKDTGTFELSSTGASQARFSSDGKKLMFFSDQEIWILYLEDFLVQPYKKAGEKELITRFSQKISDVIFFPDNEHLAFVVGDKIKITELDGRDRRNTIDFLTVPAPEIYFDAEKEIFYFLTEKKLFSLKLEK